ncbi:hypothetical protein FQR65_LT12557 [Abscondita terminalis]|nr:hypothetical protein FQR65_LT12557 [Abscondita terminalis]
MSHVLRWLSDYFLQKAIKIIQCGPIPKHLAVIVDGNRRYAKTLNKDSAYGHRIGGAKLLESFEWCRAIGITEMTVYAFSIENFKRTQEEIEVVFDVIRKLMIDAVEKYSDIEIRLVGNLELLPSDFLALLAKCSLKTMGEKKYVINFAVAYTARDEITNALEIVNQGFKNGLLLVDDIDEDLLNQVMYVQSDPDILVRSSGELRFSDFLLWQNRGAYVNFIQTMWPAFNIWMMLACVFKYQSIFKHLEFKKNIKQYGCAFIVCKMKMFVFLLLTWAGGLGSYERALPDNLLMGAATSAYQVEGASNVDGKGENIWDHLIHTRPERIADGSNADVACDSYYKYKEDVNIMKNMGFQVYRFSIAWTRILPTGFSNVVSEEGVRYYNNLIDELLANGITPMATLHHFDIPQSLQDLGGWTNPKIVKWFTDYAKVVFTRFGDRVKLWITINEPKQVCTFGYGTALLAPAINSSGIGDYMCARNLLMAHAAAYHLYSKSFKRQQNGRISITIECGWSEPKTNSIDDLEAADRKMQFDFGLYTHPIYTVRGGYPKSVQNFIDGRSKDEGFSESRLPVLKPREIAFIRGTYDYFGLNYYSSQYVLDAKPEPITGAPSITKDARVEEYFDPNWLIDSTKFFRSVPWGLRKLLKYIKDNYQNPEIMITENGFPDVEPFQDYDRVTYYKEHINAVLDAIECDGVRMGLYTAWSLMDNFEWSFGYSLRFGLNHVNFSDPNRKRTPKLSARFFKNILETRTITL